MSQGNQFQFEEIKGPKIDAFVKSHEIYYKGGLVRIWPPGCAMFSAYRENVERVRRLKVYPDDVWIVTYPKCGTTWTQEMVWLLMNNLDYDTAKKEKLVDRSPYMEYSSLISKEDTALFSVNDTIEKVESLKSPRCVKSHLPLELLPIELDTVRPKLIYVARSPKDVAVSFYHHHRLWTAYRGSCDDFVECFIDGTVVYGSMWDHVLPYWKIRNESNIQFVTYEEMKKDLPAVVLRIANFLERSISSGQLKQLCEHLSFESMKKNPMTNFELDMDPASRSYLEGKVEPFMRKGQVGGWKSDLTPQLAEKIDKWTEKKLKDTDYVGHL